MHRGLMLPRMLVSDKYIRLEANPDRSTWPPPDGSCLLPVVRQLNPLYLPIWNTSVLREEWRQQLLSERLVKEERGVLTPKQVKDNRQHLLMRSLTGPLPRLLVAECARKPVKEVRAFARDKGLWVASTEDEMGHNPFQQLMFYLFCKVDKGALWFDFDDEIEADREAQIAIDRIRADCARRTPPELGDQIGIWKVLSEPFLAVDKRNGLSWWVECRCSAEGCQHQRPRWKPVKDLKHTKAKRCKQHNLPLHRFPLLDTLEYSDEWFAIRERHIPALLRGDAELHHPDRAAGALAGYNRLLENPPSLVVPKPTPQKPLERNWSLYFPPPPYPDTPLCIADPNDPFGF